MSKEDKAMACANEIADQFRAGFCNDRMVEDFAEIICRYIQPASIPLSEGEMFHHWLYLEEREHTYLNFTDGVRYAEHQHGIGVDDE